LSHPVFLIIYILAFFHFIISSGSFFSIPVSYLIALQATVFVPLLLFFLLYFFGFVSSLKFPNKNERYLPLSLYALSAFIGFITCKFLTSNNLITLILLGVFFSNVILLVINFFLKPSLHMAGIGGAIAFFILVSISGVLINFNYIIFLVLLAGLIASARLFLKTHTNSEIFIGFITGLASFFIAALFL
jgi:hypothetical protein